MANPKTPYDLTPDALADLESIVEYTIDEWGFDQARKYHSKRSDCFVQIAEDNVFFRQIFAKHPQIRSTRCEHHYVFHVKSRTGRPTIIAVLHERMDMLRQLNKRLNR